MSKLKLLMIGTIVLLAFLIVYYNYQDYQKINNDVAQEINDIETGGLYYDLDNPSIIFFKGDYSDSFQEVDLNGDK